MSNLLVLTLGILQTSHLGPPGTDRKSVSVVTVPEKVCGSGILHLDGKGPNTWVLLQRGP